MHRTARALGSTAIVACALALSACITVTVPAQTPSRAPLTASPDRGADPDDTVAPSRGTVDCAGLPAEIPSSTGTQSLVGDCPTVAVDANDTVIDLSGADVGSLALRGDRLSVMAGDIATLEIGGQDNIISATVIGAVTIRGDRNAVDVAGEVGSATVGGNDNAVLAETVGAVVVSGSGNVVEPR